MNIIKIFFAIILSALLSACGGGGGSGGTSSSDSTPSTPTSSALSAYTGNLNLAKLNNNSIRNRKFLQIIFNTTNLGTTVSAKDDTIQAQQTGNIITSTQSLSSLAISQINNFFSQQKAIDSPIYCLSGTATISGTLNDYNGTGTLNAYYSDCAYDHKIVINGSAVFTINAVDLNKGIPTSVTMSMTGLSVSTVGGTTSELTGTQQIDINPSTYEMTATSNLYQIDTATKEAFLLRDLVISLNQNGNGTKISGMVCHHIYGCVSTTTSDNFRTDAYTGLPYAGSLTLTGLNNTSIQTLFNKDTKTGWGKFIVNIDANGDGIYETTNAEQSTKELTGTVNTPPIAQTNSPSIITDAVNSQVSIYADPSYDPDGDEISFQWSLKSKPEGSKSAIILEQYSASTVSIAPDLLGTYQIVLTVTDERGASSQATVTVELQRYNNSPYAFISAPTKTAVNTPVILDASKSSDADQDPLNFKWTITSKPADSTATLLNANNVQAGFTPDVTGSYQISLTVDDGYYYGSRTTTKTINAVNFTTVRLLHDTVDAQYSDALDKVVIVSSQPTNKLYLADLTGITEKSISLVLPPTSVAVSPDGKHAIVGHDGAVTLVNLETLKVMATHTEIGFKVADIALKNTQKAYASESGYNWNSLYEIDLQTGVATPHSGITYASLYGNARIKLQPGAENIYAIEQGLSPTDLQKFDTSSSPPTYLYDSPYHGDYPMGSNFWFSDDGNYILTAGGTMFRTTSTQSTDMRYVRSTSVNNDYTNYILAADHSATAGKFVTVTNISDDYFEPRYSVRTYTTQLLTLTETHEFDPLSLNGKDSLAEPAYAFFNAVGTNYYVILKQDNDSFLVKY